MSVKGYNYKQCFDCNGNGFIIAPESKSLASCIHCNGSGTSSYGSPTEAEQVMLFKIGLDYINGKEKGWYH